MSCNFCQSKKFFNLGLMQFCRNCRLDVIYAIFLPNLYSKNIKPDKKKGFTNPVLKLWSLERGDIQWFGSPE